MDVGIGLPNAVPGTSREDLIKWARAADDAGFSTLGTIDRIVYGNHEPLVALGAAAAVTERIRLATTVMLGPLRMNAALVAKQMLTLDAVAGGGRAVLGIGSGAREDDFELSRTSMSQRATWMEAALPEIRRIWDGDGDLEAKTGPRGSGSGPTMLVGGHADAAIERAARYGDGWIMGGGTPDQFEEMRQKFQQAWEAEGREGRPPTASLAYYSLGADPEGEAERYLGDYYAWLGDEMAGMIAGSAAKDSDTVRAYMSAFESAGCDELIFFPSSSDPAQVGALAEAAGL